MKNEAWMVVDGFPRYEVSSHGRVRRRDTQKVLATPPRSNGYMQVTLIDGPTYKNWSVHRLVAVTFLPRVRDKDLVLHINGNKSDNHLDNLYWGDFIDNTNDAKRHGTFVAGSKNGRAKLTEDDVRDIRFNLLRGVRQADLARKYKVTKSSINKIANGVTWRGVLE